MDIRCQQFTSIEISNKMLDMIDYKADLYGKKVLENSCGEGNILGLVVERYILDSISASRTLDVIKKGLENDIYGVEIVRETYELCLSHLDAIAFKFGLKEVKWNIINDDVLYYPFNTTFDYVIGNPPYISYRNLENKVREFIKENYISCKNGKPDYCYAFIENAINYLKETGKMVYLIPNSIFKNVFGEKLRNIILPYLVEIHDYPNCKLFKDALTSSAIIKLDKEIYKTEFRYYNVVQKTDYVLQKNRLTSKWIFNLPLNAKSDKNISFGELFKASITIATQRNKIFIINRLVKEKYEIEQGILRKAVSPRNLNYDNKEYIIFPYSIRKNDVYHYTEMEFENKYPNTYRYLESNKEELVLRDADKNAKWFEYGRSQAIQNMNKKKLMLSTVVTNSVKVYDVSPKTIPYSGIYIISENGNDLTLARKILESEQFLRYVKDIGTPASGSSLRITADDINNFTFKGGDLIDI